VPPQIVEQQVRKLVRSGHMEIVLVGTHLGRYGADLDQKTDLLHLLRRLACVDGLGRLRLSSLEPQEVAPALIEALADGGSALDPHADRLACKGKLCRHLHIPLQSGSDDVLRAMGRPYDTEFYARLLQQLVAQVPGICIGADCIVGFPGETDDHFAQTLTFVRSLPLAYLHVFTFSPRAGTRAAALDGQVPADEMQARNHVLRNLSLTKSVHFAQTQLGQVLEVIPERRNPAGYLQSLSDNYLRVQHSGPDLLLGRLVRVRILQACGQTLFGETANQGDTAA
jgi:threonylcarbamoyladenosine tRNA methylthiotransferase MtaB